MKREQRRVCEIIKQTVVMLCERGFTADNIEIRGVIGVTINNSEVLVIHINEDVEGCDDESLQQSCDLNIGESSACYRDAKNPPMSPSSLQLSLSHSNISAEEHLVFPVLVRGKNKSEINYHESLPCLTTTCADIKQEDRCGDYCEGDDLVINDSKVEEEDNLCELRNPGNDYMKVVDPGVTSLRIASVVGNAAGRQTGDDDVTDSYAVVKQESFSHPVNDDVINNSSCQSLRNNCFLSPMSSTEFQKSYGSLKTRDPSDSDVVRVCGSSSRGSGSCRSSSQTKPCISLSRIDAPRCKRISILQPVVNEVTSDEQAMEQSVSYSDQDNNNDMVESFAAVERFTCAHCCKRFANLSHLERHMRTHTGEKPFKCTLCSMRFTEAGSLKRHLRTHTGEKPFHCTQCNKAFSEVGNLKKHVNRCHSG